MADLRQAFDYILREWGHNILLQRWNGVECKYETTLERHTVRHKYPAVRGLPGIMQEQPEGLTHVVDMIYYFRRDAKPKEGDRIYEEDERYAGYPDNNTGKTVWLIDYALPMRGRGGKVDYWMVGCTRARPN